MAVSFNLVDEPWIPIVWQDGTAGEVGLRDALVRAHEIRELVDGSPLVTVSLHRLLLAILHRNFGPSTFETWKPLWQAGQWDAATLDGYFATWRHRFDLFDAERPFYQVGSLEEGTKVHPPALLAQERAAGNNATLFDHSFASGQRSMLPADAARYLVARQAFSVGGGVAKPFNLSNATLTAGFTVLAEGTSLFETLALNLTEYGPGHTVRPDVDDILTWERDSPPEPDRNGTRPRGPLDYLTWQSRRIKLLVQDEPLSVTGVQLAQNMKLDTETPDPFKSYARSTEQGWVARRLDPDRAVWRDSHAIFQQSGENGRRPLVFNWLAQVYRAARRREIEAQSAYTVSVLGLGREATAKAADIHIWRHERFTVPLAYLDDGALLSELREALRLADEIGALFRPGSANITVGEKTFKAARPFQVLAKVLLAVGENQPDRRRVASTIEHLAPERRYWSKLEVPFRTLLADLAGDRPEAAQEAWAVALQDAAWSAFREATSGLDRSARALEAVARAEHELRRRLADCLGNHLPQREGATT